MTVPKQKQRESLVVLLYSLDFHDEASEEELLEVAGEQLKLPTRTLTDSLSQAKKIRAMREELDDKLASVVVSYETHRIGMMERNILRLGLYELLYDEEIPPKVAIAEALRLSKKFATPATTRFVNALLDHIYQESLGRPVSDDALKKSIDELTETQAEVEKVIELERDTPPTD